MAEPRDEQPAGRMLFTDFDASDKGRPTANFGDPSGAAGRERSRRGPAIRSLDDIVSTLDFGFEDDDGEAFPPSRRLGPAAVGPAFPPDGDESRDGEPASFGRGGTRARYAAPTWADFADSFALPSRAEREDAREPSRIPAAGRRSGKFGAPAEPEAPYADPAFDMDGDAEVDILSLLSAEDDEGREPPPGTDEGGDWRGGRLGLEPPRALPYGGVRRLKEWYRPPEDAGGEKAGVANADWYEPPDGRGTADGAPETAIAHFNPAEDASGDDGEREAANTRFSARNERRASDTTRQIDVFRGVDVDSLWNERMTDRRTETADTSTSSRDFAFFDNEDLDDEWESKLAGAVGEPSAKPAGPDAGAEETAIIDPKAFDNASTMVMSQEEINRQIRPAAADDALAPPTKKPAGRRESAAPASADDSAEFLDGLDQLFSDVAGDDPLKAGVHPLPLPPPVSNSESDSDADADADAGDADGADDNPDAFDLDRLIAMTDAGARDADDSVAAPVIGDGDIAAPRGRLREGGGGGAASDDDLYIPSDLVSAVPAAGDSVEAAVADAPGGEAASAEEEAVAVDPMDVFANMDDMDFSDDGLDDDMKAMLDDDGDEASGDGAEDASASAAPAAEEKPPEGRVGRILFHAKRAVGAAVRKVVPQTLLNRVTAMIAWRENWWFYCDLLAAVIASASLAIIVSYYVWYKN